MRKSASTLLISLALTLGVAAPLSAQQEPASVEQVAALVASPDSRQEALLELSALAHRQLRTVEAGAPEFADAAAQDRAWLDRLVARRGSAVPVSPVLDPAAWMIRQNLVRQGFSGSDLPSPAGPGFERLLRATFQRADERLAATVLPQLLWHTEARATAIWASLLEQSAADPNLRAALALRVPAESATAAEESLSGSRSAADLLTLIADGAVEEGPPDRRRVARLRRLVLMDVVALPPSGGFTLVSFMRLGNLIDQLHEGRFTGFAEGLLAIAGDLLDADPESAAPVAAWLGEHLPRISSVYARAFSEVDPRLNSAVAAVYDVAESLPGDVGESVLGDELADAVAQLALLMPDIEYYFGLPIRDTIAGTVDACAGLMAQSEEGGRAGMTRELFDDCIESLVRIADNETRAPGLSGDPKGPFGPDQLQREVSVTPVQRINYGLGYLAERFGPECTVEGRPLPNPLEWSSLATLMAWFAERMPVYFQTPQNEARLASMRRVGADLAESLTRQAACYAGSGEGANDPVFRILADYQAALNRLSRGVREGVAAFRQEVLAPGADIALEADALQETLYRPERLEIVPCDVERVCEMASPLAANRALVGLFPEPYLVADQSGLGEVQLCYENMEWVDRRSEPVRPDDDNVANYFGRFAFDLKGRFSSAGEVVDVFGFRFTSPDEHHYLFAAASEEVLADSCPMEWVGSRIVTTLPGNRGGIVPNRLTYLAAPRMLPSRLLEQNWQKGSEWRDWFITGLGVDRMDLAPPDDIVPQVSEHLKSLYLREQAVIYRALLDGAAMPGDIPAQTHLQDLTTQKGLVRMMALLFFPQSVVGHDDIRAGLAGQGGLLDEEVLTRFRERDVPVNRIGELGLVRLETFRSAWRQQSDAALRGGSVATGEANAVLRLDQVYWNHFRAPAESLPPETGSAAEEAVTEPVPPASADG